MSIDYVASYEPSIVRTWLITKTRGNIKRSVDDLNNYLDGNHRLSRVYEWARGKRKVPPEVYDFMLMDLLVNEGYSEMGDKAYEELRHPVPKNPEPENL